MSKPEQDPREPNLFLTSVLDMRIAAKALELSGLNPEGEQFLSSVSEVHEALLAANPDHVDSATISVPGATR